MNTARIRIPFEYEIVGQRKRVRNPARWRVRETFEADVPVYEKKQVQDTFKGRGDPVGIDGRVHVMCDHAKADGEFLPEIYLDPSRCAATRSLSYDEMIDRILTNPAGGFQTRPAFTLSNADSKFGKAPVVDRAIFINDPASISNISRSTREQSLASAKVEAREICFVENKLYTSRFEPCLVIGHKGRKTGLYDIFDTEIAFQDVVDLPHGEMALALNASREGIGGSYPARLPKFDIRVRLALKEAYRMVFPNSQMLAAIGSGALGHVDIPAELDETAFDLRRSLRSITPDLRGGLHDPEDIGVAIERLSRFAEILSEETKYRPSLDPAGLNNLLERIYSISKEWSSMDPSRSSDASNAALEGARP